MIYNRLKKLGQAKGWYRTQSSIFGIHNQFLFNIYQSGIMSSPAFKCIVCRTEPMSEDSAGALRTLLESNKKNGNYDLVEVGTNYISVTFYEHLLPTKVARLEQMLDLLSNELLQRNLKSFYKTAENLNYYDLSGEGVFLSTQGFIAKASEMGQNNFEEGLERHSYFQGFIGSLIYSLPVIFLWVVTALFLERLSSGFGTIIALLGHVGYERFKGKLGLGSKWILIVSNLLVIFLANIVTTGFMLWRLGVSTGQMLNLWRTDASVQKIFESNLVISLILGMVGWLYILFSVDTSKKFIKEAQKL